MIIDLGKSQKKCRILYLVGQLGTGGLERQLCYLLHAMDRQRYSPVVVVWNYKEDDIYVRQIQDLGVQVRALPKTGGGVAKLLGFRQLVKILQPEVVHSYCFYTNFAAYFGALGRSLVAIGSVRGDLIRYKHDTGFLLGKLSARWPTTQIYNSFMAAETTQQAGGLFRPNRVLVVRNGLNLETFRKVELTVHSKVNILAVGSLLPIKRWDRLIKAASDLKRDGLDFHVQIVGEGPLRSPLEKQVADQDLKEFVTFLGYRNDIPELLVNCSFLAHTSDSEGCPNVVMEAMACGRAIVATGVGDVPYLLENRITGYVVDTNDHKALIECMGTLIKNPELCRRMGEAGRAKAEKAFGLDRLVAETFGVYTSAGWKHD